MCQVNSFYFLFIIILKVYFISGKLERASEVKKLCDENQVDLTLPDTVQHLEHAQILFNNMEPKIAEIERFYARCIQTVNLIVHSILA